MGGGEEGGHVIGGDGVRGDKVMGDIRMQFPHDVDTYVSQSKLSIDAKESNSTAHQEMRSRR
jgi:hypothetical protein